MFPAQLAKLIADSAQVMPKISGKAAPLPTAGDAHVMTRAEWQAARDKAGGKSGMVRGVDIGSLLDAWHKAMNREPSFTVASKGVDKQTHALILGLNKYKADRTVARTLALRETVEAQLKAIDAHMRRAGAATRTAAGLGARLTDLKAAATANPPSFKKIKTHVNLVGTSLRDLSNLDASVDPIAVWWRSGVGARKSVGGVNADEKDSPQYQAEAAVELAKLVDKVRAELVRNRIVA